MTLYRYEKAAPKQVRIKSRSKRGFTVSIVLLLTGIVIIGWVVHPIVAFEITSRFKYGNSNFPTQKTENSSTAIASEAFSDSINSPTTQDQVLGSSDYPVTTEVDYNLASTWYPKKPQHDTTMSGRIYFLSIPKLKIKDAMVKIAGDDLNKSLIHYGGTGLPGEYGTSVIFGHSILPQFYNPENYKTIFALLPKLVNGDEVFVKYDGITYRYVVGEIRVTTPEDLTVLEQRYDNSYISLITCVPPGTYWKRLLVRARLTPS